MLKRFSDILPQPIAHGVGQKRVLLKQAEMDTNLTQIAVTTLQVGEKNTPTRPWRSVSSFSAGKRISDIKYEISNISNKNYGQKRT